MDNIYAHFPEHLPEEFFEQLATGKAFSLKRIVSRGHTTGWQDQDQNEWVLLLSGAATLAFENNHTETLQPGDYLLIPAHRKHRVAWTDPDRETIWLAIHFDSGLPVTPDLL